MGLSIVTRSDGHKEHMSITCYVVVVFSQSAWLKLHILCIFKFTVTQLMGHVFPRASLITTT